jgi:hypothetical protein
MTTQRFDSPSTPVMPLHRIIAAMVAMAILTGVISTYALFAFMPELFG